MNNFKELAKLTHEHKSKINAMYEKINDFKALPQEFQRALSLCGLKESKELRLAILRRFVDLKEENLLEEFKKAHLSEVKSKELCYQIYDEVVHFYENSHKSLIDEAKNWLEPFYRALLEGVHQIGLVMNELHKLWSKQILDTNNKILATQFKSLDKALSFLRKNELFQRDRSGEPCERSYGLLIRIGNLWKFVPYAAFFEDEYLRLEYAFDELLGNLQKLAQNEEHRDYITYLSKLKFAFMRKENEEVIAAWQEAELAWLEVKSPLQIAHPLEYYEDNYTHAVALEWDLRLNDENEFNAKQFCQNIIHSFAKLYENTGLKDEELLKQVQGNLAKTQLYICMPMLYYGAQMNGLFSAQVVPNDEFVSNEGGKKIFAFVNFVYESARSKPFMLLASEVFEKEFLKYGREILFFKPEIWKKVYEIATIGHEFGHIFFISQDTEKKMNTSGRFKNIEEFKATAGGLMNFFLNEKEELILPVFYEFIKRAVSLIAWQRVEQVKPYYTEGLTSLSLLFESKVLGFEEGKLSIDFSLESYANFKAFFMKTYYELARTYMQKRDANEFLSKFCVLEDEIFLPLQKECKDFVKYYYALYEKIGNELDESGEFEKYKNAVKA